MRQFCVNLAADSARVVGGGLTCPTGGLGGEAVAGGKGVSCRGVHHNGVERRVRVGPTWGERQSHSIREHRGRENERTRGEKIVRQSRRGTEGERDGEKETHRGIGRE